MNRQIVTEDLKHIQGGRANNGILVVDFFGAAGYCSSRMNQSRMFKLVERKWFDIPVEDAAFTMHACMGNRFPR